jgi:PAS domain S-box-containing protein
MHIRRKILIVVIITLLLFTGVIQVVTSSVLNNRFRDMEDNEVEEQFTRVSNAMEAQKTLILNNIRDYSNWDDLYEYVLNPTPEFIASGLNPSAYLALKISTIVITQANGSIIYSGKMEKVSGMIEPADDAITSMFGENGDMTSLMQAGNEVSGYIGASNVNYFIACSEIRRSDMTGTVNGYLTFLREIDPSTVSDISTFSSYDIRISKFEPNYYYDGLETEEMDALIAQDRYSDKESDEKILIYQLERDVNGAPLLVVSSTMTRNLNLDRIDMTYQYLAYFAILAVIIVSLMFVMVERVVVSRVVKLDDDVEQIGKGSDPGKRIPITGKDEISTLAMSINKMLSGLEKAQAEYLTNEKRYRAIVEDQTELIFRIDPEFKISFANESFCRYYREDCSKIIGISVIEKLVTEDRQKAMAIIRSMDQKDSSICVELRCQEPGDSVSWQQWTIRSILNEKEIIAEYQIVARDVSEQHAAGEELRNYRDNLEVMVKDRTAELMVVNQVLEKEVEKRRLVEQELQESQMQYRSVVEDQTELIFRMTGEGSISFANGAFKRYYSLDGKRVLGQTFMPTLLDDDISKFTNFLAALTPYNPMGMVQYRVQLKEEIRWQQWTYRMIYDQNGLLREIQGVGRDITEQKRIEDEILRSDKLESLGMLAGGMAHEFNNVLTKVLGNITLAKTMVQPNDPLFKRLDNTERSIYDAKRLTDSILTFSDGGEPIKETLSVRDLLYDSSSTAVIGTNVSPKFDLQDDLFNIEADHSQMIQAMRAIFSNAVESMPNGGNVKVVARNVELETNENGLDLFPGSYVRIDIIDHGVGIPKEKLLHIFDPYFTTKGSGGLGLTTALSIVKRHKGNILVESAVSLGSKFGIFLPATLNEIRSDERAEDEGYGDRPRPPHGR